MIHADKKSDVYVLRGGDHFEKYGDPYTFTMIIELSENNEIAKIESFCRNQDGTELGKKH